MQLRPYQADAVTACYNALRTRTDNPCIVLPTGAGKTALIGTICRDAVLAWGGRVIVLAHVKELLEQSAEKIGIIAKGVPIGVYSAGLKRRQKAEPVIVAGIQSVYERACELGPFNLALVDECHLLPPEGEGMYRQFLKEARLVNPGLRLIGLTATPYRMSTGALCGPGELLNHICYEVGVKELIRDGYLCPVRSKKGGGQQADLSGVHIRGGEFIENELQSAMLDPAVMAAAIEDIAQHSADRKSTLIFSCGIEHAQEIAAQLAAKTGAEVATIFGSTPPAERAKTLLRFKLGEIRYLVNVNVLTTGFDAPNIDCVAMLRPTLSPGLYYQMVGRGFRKHESKADCLVLDYGANVQRHGPVDCIRADGSSGGTGAGAGEGPTKECPNCHELIAAGYGKCPACEFEFPPREGPKHATRASEKNVISDDSEISDHEVYDIEFLEHKKKDAPEGHPPTMRVKYRIGMLDHVSEWVCFEHQGFALSKARLWWSARSGWECPETVERAIELCQDGAIATTLAIRVRKEAGRGKFPEIIGVDLGEKPADGVYLEPVAPKAEETPDFDDSDIPF